MRSLNRPPASFVLTPRPWKGVIPTNWSRNRKAVKVFVEWALKNQNNQCSICGFIVDDVSVRRSPAVDHFAPQGDTLHPQWRFEPLNLVVTCHSCNSVFKGGYDTVMTTSAVYAKCTFFLIHPYLDSVSNHITGTYLGGTQTIGAPVFHTLKGLRTIRKFKLDDPDYIVSINKQAVSLLLDHWEKNAPADETKLFNVIANELGSIRSNSNKA